MADIQELLEKRKAQKSKKPHFLRKDWYKKKRLAQVWRKPKGLHNKLGKNHKNHGSKPGTCFGGLAAVRNLHKSGLMPIIVCTVAEISKVDPKTQAAIISSTVGKRKKIEIMTKAKEKSIRILNFKDTEAYMTTAKDQLSKRKTSREKSAEEKQTKSQEAEKKSEEKKEEAKSQEEHKEAEKKKAEKIITKSEK